MTTLIDHNIPLDDLLADAATELRSSNMLALAQAVDIARDRLAGRDANLSSTRLINLEEDSPSSPDATAPVTLVK